MAEPIPQTIPAFLAAAASDRDRPALAAVESGQLVWRSWGQVLLDVRRVAGGIAARDIQPGDRVAQTAPNCYGWVIADLAILSLGAVHVPLHASSTNEQIRQQIEHSGAKLLLTDDSAGQRDLAVPRLSHGELFHGSSTSTAALGDGLGPDSLATILYTSGTTGEPRGVMLTHSNLVSNAVALVEAVATGSNEVRLCLLPLSHIYARTCDLYTWLVRGSRLVLAESRDTILRDCQLVRPTAINAVPYFYQKVAQRLESAGKAECLGALREALGGELKRCFCGGAAVAPETEALFERQGLPVLSGYGLTEASPVVTASGPEDYAAGSVGRPLPGAEVRVAGDGELLVRGPGVMRGYWRDEPATSAALANGWLHTGDLGRLDDAGRLFITGRKKEIIVLSTGKNVDPARVEALLCGSRWVEQALVVGDGRKCLGALIVPNPEALRAEIRRRRLWVWSKRRAVTHPRVVELYREEIDRCLASAAPEERVGPFRLLARGFTPELGELTPKLSLRRGVLTEHFGIEIAELFDGKAGRPAPPDPPPA
ncbi:MAG: AMP-dependent synthetase/ligase [Planctomycetota bacterium]